VQSVVKLVTRSSFSFINQLCDVLCCITYRGCLVSNWECSLDSLSRKECNCFYFLYEIVQLNNLGGIVIS